MKRIGLIGGITWVSTLEYYRLLNEMLNHQKGGSESADIVLHSLNFGPIKSFTEAGNWDAITKIVSDSAIRLQNAGADCVLLGANTMHKIADRIQDRINIPLIHIADVTAAAISKKGLRKVALLGTRYTMQLDFYKNALASKGIDTIIPNTEDIEQINTAIYEELGKNIFLPATKARFIEIINQLVKAGAEGVILGCTEIPLLIKQPDCPVPVFDTASLHAEAAVAFALGTESPGA